METTIPTTPAYHHETEYAQPIAQTNRIQTLDILRGVALLGIFSINIWTFGMSHDTFYRIYRGPHDVNFWLNTFFGIVVEGKMRALFSMLFGAGILLFLTKKQRANSDLVQQPAPVDLFVRRQLWLMLFGLVNAYVLIWQWDILFHYGMVGILLFTYRHWPAKAFLLGAVVITLIYSGRNYWDFAEQKATYTKYQSVVALEKAKKKLTNAQQNDKKAGVALLKSHQPDPNAEAAEIAAMRSDYATVWSYRVPRIQDIQRTGFYKTWLWDIASLMLLGMALFKWGFFSNQLTTQQYALLAVGCLLLGQAMALYFEGLVAVKYIDYEAYIRTPAIPLYRLLTPFERILSAVGWAALVVLLYRLTVGGWLWQGLRALGQMAFTNYLMQSILGTLFFNGYGLGYFGSLQIYQLYIVVAGVWLFQILFSVVWLRYFRFGPLEWLWRSLTYWQRQSMRRTATVD